MMEGGHFLIHMQKTGPKLAIFHGFWPFLKKFRPLDLKKLGGLGAGVSSIYVSFYRNTWPYLIVVCSNRMRMRNSRLSLCGCS